MRLPAFFVPLKSVSPVVWSLIDLSLALNLVPIVVFSGYENFVSRIDTGDSEDRPQWMGTLDFSGMKMKLIGSIVAISAISLLRASAYLARLGARELRTAVLVDRCCNKLPVKADICGLRLTVPAGDVIECRVPPYEPILQVDIWHRAP